MDNEWMFNLIPIIFMLIGAVILLKGVRSFLKKRKLAEVAFTATGTVTNVTWESLANSTSKAHQPTIRFVTNVGQTIEFTETEDLNNWTFYQIGQELPVSYDPKNPQNAKMGTPASISSWFSLSSILPILAGALFLIVGSQFLFSPFGSFSSGSRSSRSASSSATTTTPTPKGTPARPLSISEACSRRQDDWVQVEGYAGPATYVPSPQDRFRIHLYSGPSGEGDSVLIWAAKEQVGRRLNVSFEDGRLRTRDGRVTDSSTWIFLRGQLDFSNGTCELRNVSDVTRP